MAINKKISNISIKEQIINTLNAISKLPREKLRNPEKHKNCIAMSKSLQEYKKLKHA